MKPNSGILATPGVGATIAMHDIGGVLYEADVACDATGHIQGTLDTFVAWFPWTVLVAAARTTHLDLFNASGSGKVLRVRALIAKVGIAAAVTGVGFHWELVKTSAVGTGGTAITPRPRDSANAALPAQITARQKPTGGATTAHLVDGFALHSEETHAASHLLAGVNLMAPCNGGQMLVLREGEGLKVDQVTNSAAGNVGWTLVFTAE